MTIDEIEKLTDQMYMQWLDCPRSQQRDLRRDIFLVGHAEAMAYWQVNAAEWQARAEKAEKERDELRLAASALAEASAWLTNIDRTPSHQRTVGQWVKVNNAIRHMRKTLAEKAGDQ